jgi:hypothetical protein
LRRPLVHRKSGFAVQNRFNLNLTSAITHIHRPAESLVLAQSSRAGKAELEFVAQTSNTVLSLRRFVAPNNHVNCMRFFAPLVYGANNQHHD